MQLKYNSSYWYWGLMLPCLLCSVLFFFYLFRGQQRIKLNSYQVLSYALNILIVGWIGALSSAKLDFYLQGRLSVNKDLESYLFFAFDGQRWYGAFLFGLVYCSFFVYRSVSIKEYFVFLDKVSFTLCFFFVFGKIACFLSGHTGACAGSDSNLPWSVKSSFSNNMVHPRQIYDALFHFFLFLILLFSNRKYSCQIGLISFVFLFSSVIYSFLSEFISQNKDFILGLRLAQIGYIIIFMLVLYNYWLYIQYRPLKDFPENKC